MTNIEDRFKPDPMTREEFVEANPFGSIKIQIGTEEPRDMTEAEYEEFVENSRGIWDDQN